MTDMTRDWAVDAAEEAMLLMQCPVIDKDGKVVFSDTDVMRVIAARIRTHYYAQEPIDAHLAKAAQGEAVAWQYRRDGVEWHPLKDEFIEKAIRDGVEVRALYAALAHPRPSGDEAVSLDEVSADIDALIARVEQGTLSRADVVSLVRRKIGPSWQDRSALTGEQAGKEV